MVASLKFTALALAFFALALFLPYVVSPLLKKLQLVDTPNHRSAHTTPTIRGAGLAVALAIILGLVASLFIFDLEANNLAIGVTVLLTVVLTAALGFIEDTRGISVKGRLGCQLLLSAAVALWMLYLTDQHPIWAVPLALVGMFYINAANFMDGINGISSIHGILLGATAFIVGVLESNAALLTIGSIISLSFLGFLPWNFPNAQMFLGDVGSYVVGGLYFAIGFWTFFVTGSLFLAIAPGLYYIFDVLYTLVVRKHRGKDLTEAHRDHLYQQLQRCQGSHVSATLIAVFISFLVTVLALAGTYDLIPMPVTLLLCLVALLVLPLTLGKQRGPA